VTIRNCSASRLAHASRLAAALLGLGLSLSAGQAPAQPVTPQFAVVVDLQHVLREAAAAGALRAIEAEERRALRQRLDQLTEAFRIEEAELTRLRATLDKDSFDVRVQDFDQRVRAARQAAQESSVAFQNRFAEAFGALEREAVPVVAALMTERGAVVALDRRSVLVFSDGADVTAEVIRRLDRALPANAARDLLPPMPAPR
jgi:Skp family chaperone for outer membrane proteins